MLRSLLLVVLVLATAVLAQEDNYVFLISIDGLRADYLLRADELGVSIPNLRSLMANGVLAEGAHTVTPAVTYPAHTSMITGVVPNRHGILYNGKFDPTGLGRGSFYFEYDIEADTIFKAAKRAGLSTAGVNWPTSCGESLDYNVPDAFGRDEQELLYLRACSHGPYKDIVSTPQDFDEVNDAERAKIAVAFTLADGAPHRLNAFHISGLDGAQHSHGVFSQAAFTELEVQDTLLGEMLEAIDRSGVRNRSTIFIVSDHGFINATQQAAPGVLLAQRGLTQDPWKAYPYSGSGSLAIMISDPNDAATKAQVAAVVAELVAGDYGINAAWVGDQVEPLGGWRDAYAVLEAQVGWTLSGSVTGSVTEPVSLRGIHGHTPFNHPEILGSFLASGYGVAQGKRVPTVQLLDVAPTIASLLDLELTTPGGLDGRVLTEIFA